MMNALGDQHSSYMDPKNFAEANSSLAGEYEGIGAYVDTSTEYLTITSPMPGSPAERAGLLSGDQIVAIDHVDMTGTSAEVARTKVLGPANTKVHLTVARKGEDKLLEFDVTREKITMKSSTGKMLDSGIAYIQITTFGEKTTPELLATLKESVRSLLTRVLYSTKNTETRHVPLTMSSPAVWQQTRKSQWWCSSTKALHPLPRLWRERYKIPDVPNWSASHPMAKARCKIGSRSAATMARYASPSPSGLRQMNTPSTRSDLLLIYSWNEPRKITKQNAIHNWTQLWKHCWR
jgi:hypothetical protein